MDLLDAIFEIEDEQVIQENKRLDIAPAWMVTLQWVSYLVGICCVVRGVQNNYRNVRGAVVQY